MSITNEYEPYICNGSVVPVKNDKLEFNKDQRKVLKENLKMGIYKELHKKNLLTYSEFQFLAEKQRKH